MLKNKKYIEFVDYIYPITNLSKSIYKIKDHINLSGSNLLKGPMFISLGNIYYSKDGIIVACLKEGVHPSNKEKKVLLKAGVQAYCYNLVSAAFHAALSRLKLKATGVVQKQK